MCNSRQASTARGLKVGHKRTHEGGKGERLHTQCRCTNAWGHTHFNTYRNAFAFDAVHDSEGRAQIREPGGAQFPYLLAERAFCNKEIYFNGTGEFVVHFFSSWSNSKWSGACMCTQLWGVVWKMAWLKYLKANRTRSSRWDGEGAVKEKGFMSKYLGCTEQLKYYFYQVA